MTARPSARSIARRTAATALSLMLLMPVAGVATATAMEPAPVAPGKKLHVCVTKDKLLRLAPFNKSSYCKPDQMSAHLAVGSTKGLSSHSSAPRGARQERGQGKDGANGTDD